jgi:gamma-butyrobetaine dioxygenase
MAIDSDREHPASVGSDQPGVESASDGLVITWPDGVEAAFHFFWLRENCGCGACCHAEAWERIVGLLDIPLDIEPARVTADGGGLHLEWVDGPPCEGTVYSWDFLRRHRTEIEARRERSFTPPRWWASDIDPTAVHLQWGAVAVDDRALEAALTSVEQLGFVILEGVPLEEDAVLDVAARIAHVQESHFGRSFRVESKHDPENLAYTPRRLDPHNDLPSRQELPGLQLLHCLVNDAMGGESVLVDGLAVSERLRSEDPASFDLLSTVAVRYTSVGDDWEISTRKPVIQLDSDGAVIGTCFHPALLGPVDVEPGRMGAFYAAYRAMLSITVDPAMQFTFRLGAGQCQIFDNRRVLHARQAFDPTTGARLLRGCYVPLDDARSRLAVLRRRSAEFRGR